MSKDRQVHVNSGMRRGSAEGDGLNVQYKGRGLMSCFCTGKTLRCSKDVAAIWQLRHSYKPDMMIRGNKRSFAGLRRLFHPESLGLFYIVSSACELLQETICVRVLRAVAGAVIQQQVGHGSRLGRLISACVVASLH
jgi:hypothetical protein